MKEIELSDATHGPEAAVAPRPSVAEARRIVIKLGTRVLTHADGRIALSRMFAVVETVARLHSSGREVLVVSSGAVGLGRDALGLPTAPTELAERQACAAVGQSRLMALYEAGFSRLGIICGQVLLTEDDFDDRLRYLNLRSTLLTMLDRRVVPIINENDAVSVAELAWGDGPDDARQVFGDNDRLSALVAARLDADLLVLLTDVDGVYETDPNVAPDARLVDRYDVAASDHDVVAGDSRSGAGRGGMRSKVESAAIAARSGCHVVIASGKTGDALDRVLAGESIGTWFPALPALPARHRWIAWATASRGQLVLDPGAVAALRDRGASLLAAGVKRVEGAFRRGDVVDLLSLDGKRVGRGIVCCDIDVARRWCAGERPSFARNHHALVHRDHLVLDPV
jgi:glutamate 5-kinase